MLRSGFRKGWIVIAGLVPAIPMRKHCALSIGMAGTSPAMTVERVQHDQKTF
jgi:hypothetical protein